MSLKSYCWRFGKHLLSACAMDRAVGNHRWPIKQSKCGHLRRGLSFDWEGYLEITFPSRTSPHLQGCLSGWHLGACTLVLACIPWPQVLNRQPLVNRHVLSQGKFEGSSFPGFMFQVYMISYRRRINNDYSESHHKNGIYGDLFCWKTYICFLECFLCWRLFSHPKVTCRCLSPFQL